METNELIYDAWVPVASPWSVWAKPVLFAYAEGHAGVGSPPSAAVPDVPTSDGTTAIVVDLPGAAGVAVGVALAGRGYRPVPLYNALPGDPGATVLVDVRSVLRSLVGFAPVLRQLALPDDAAPAFLLDHDRRVGTGAGPAPGVYDNRSVSLATDFPSAGFLASRGVRRVVLIQPTAAEPQADLAHTLRRWQEAKLSLLRVAVDAPTQRPATFSVQRPSKFRWLWQRVLAVGGLQRHALGGFGGTLPVPSAG